MLKGSEVEVLKAPPNASYARYAITSATQRKPTAVQTILRENTFQIEVRDAALP